MSQSGRKPRVDDDEIVAVFDAAKTPVLTTRDVAEQLPISRRTALTRLKALREAGRLESMDVGAKAKVWWADTDRGEESTAPAEPLRDLVGMLDEDEAAAARERSQEWRESFNREMDASNASGS